MYISKYTCCMNYTDYIMQYENLGTTASVQTWRQKRRQKLMGNWFLWHTVGRPTHAFYLLDSSSLTSPPPLLSFKQFPKVFLVNIIFLKLTNHITHVLAHLLKSLTAYNVKSSSTLFSENIQWNLEISFSCARFNSLVGYNLLTKKLGPPGIRLFRPLYSKTEERSFKCNILLWKILTRVSIEF